MYHLASPRHYLEVGRVDFVPAIRGSYTPALSHMHYALFVALRLDCGAKLVNLVMSVVLLLLAFEVGRAWGSRLAGAVAGTLLALTPLVAWEAGTAYLDNALATLGLGTLLLLLQGIRRRRRSWLVAGGLLAGGALFTRYQAIPLVAALALVAGVTLAVSRRRWRGSLAGALLLAIGLALLVPLPHWARNLWQAGNPIFPLLDHVFPTRIWFDAHDLDFFNRTNFDNFGFGRDGISLLLAPWRLVLQETGFNGHDQQALGLIWLVLLPTALLGAFRRARNLPLAIAAFLVFGGWFLTMQVARYLLPVLALGAVLAGLGIAGLARGRHGTVAAVALLALASAVVQSPGALSTETDLALAGEARERFLDARVSSHRVLRQQVAELAEDATVWAFMDQGAVYYYPRRVLGDWFGPHKYSRIAASLLPFAFRPGQEVVATLESWGVTHVLLNLPATPGFRPDGSDPEALLSLRDPVLAEHLELLYSDRGVFLYAFDAAAAPAAERQPRIGANRLSNPSFETPLAGAGIGWGVVGEPAVVPDALGAPAGERVLRTDLENYPFQYFDTRGGGRFLATCQARAEGGEPALMRLQVLWIDDGGEIVDSAISVRSSAAGRYVRLSATFTAPAAAARGIFHVLGHESDWVRIDDVTLREILPGEPGEAAPARP
jgi:4-amino-4-deoxy-L-arabinose transferase-like glycosyltransferase